MTDRIEEAAKVMWTHVMGNSTPWEAASPASQEWYRRYVRVVEPLLGSQEPLRSAVLALKQNENRETWAAVDAALGAPLHSEPTEPLCKHGYSEAGQCSCFLAPAGVAVQEDVIADVDCLLHKLGLNQALRMSTIDTIRRLLPARAERDRAVEAVRTVRETVHAFLLLPHHEQLRLMLPYVTEEEKTTIENDVELFALGFRRAKATAQIYALSLAIDQAAVRRADAGEERGKA